MLTSLKYSFYFNKAFCGTKRERLQFPTRLTLLLTASLKGKNMQHFYVVDYSLTGKQTNVSYSH